MSHNEGKKRTVSSATLQRLSFAVLLLYLAIFAVAIVTSILYLKQRSGEDVLFITTNIAIAILGSIGIWLLRYTIRSRKELEEALETSEEEYRTLIANINLGIYRNTGGPKGKFLMANPAIVKMFGHDSEEEFMELAVSDLYENPAQRAKYVEKIAKKGFVKDEVLKLSRKDGTTFIGSVTAKVKYDSKGNIMWIDSAMEDVTAQKEAEQKLKEAKHHLEVESLNTKKFMQAVENSSIATIITTPDPFILYANPAWEQITGYSEAEALGEDPKISYSGKTPQKVYETMWKKVLNGEEFNTDEIINKRKDGSEYYADLRVYPITEKGKVTFIVGLQTDITSRIRADRAKSDFVSLSSHQLRTPLTNLKWAFEVLAKGKVGKLSGKQSEIVVSAQEFITQMNEIVSTLLNLSRIEAGKIEVRNTKVNVQEFFRWIEKELKISSENKKQVLTLDCPENMTLETDESLLNEIGINLLSNAVRYTPEKGTISLKCEKEGNSIIIRIQDSGYGIPNNQQDKVFTKFFRGRNVITKETEGTGLGLYLVYNLVRILSGEISFISEENTGTTFTLRLPVTPPPHR